MTVLYNEFDPYPAQWLRNLGAAGHIARGHVDDRSILELTPNAFRHYTQVHLFAGIGGWSHALRLAGWDDARSVWTVSCPCQPFSQAGKGKGFADERHLWPKVNDLIGECRPEHIFGEQVASPDGIAWLDLVQSALEAKGYAFGAVVLAAAGFGAPHQRHRIFFTAKRMADAYHAELEGRVGVPECADQRPIGEDSLAGGLAYPNSAGWIEGQLT